MFLANKLNKGAGAPTPVDPQFNYVTLLLHGDGTNGGQNNTFLDSSTNNFTITRNGNTTQGSFSPYGPNWSTSFNQIAGQVLAIGTNTALDLTGDFTIELWFFGNTLPTFSVLWDTSLAGGAGSEMSECYVYENGRTALYIRGTEVCLTSEGVIVAGSWNHIACTRSGTACTVWVNGVSRATGTSASGINTGYTWRIGDRVASAGSGNWPVNGYISNFRIVKGTALYTGTFTPSTTPLTAVSGTSLLTCQSNRFIDNSTNNFAITVNGNTSVQRFSPFAPPAAYTTATIGGSGYFDGTGDYLTGPTNNAAFQFGTGDFTIEMWVYTANLSAFQTLVDTRPANTESAYGVFINNTAFPYWYDASGFSTSSVAVSSNTWTHVAVSRASGTLRIFVNGVSGYSAANTNSQDPTGAIKIGDNFSSSATYFGYISNLRVVKGTAVYTSAFTPPTAPLTAITNTSVLLNFTNAAIFDNAMMNDLETVGNAQISTSVVKYGTGSISFDGSDSNLSTVDTPQSDLGSGDFTIEAWVYVNALNSSGAGWIVQWTSSLAWYFGTSLSPANSFIFGWTTDGSTIQSINSNTIVSTGSWAHYAVSRSGNTARLFINGILANSGTLSGTIFNSTDPVVIGNNPNGAGNWRLNGYIDDLRITKGVARYTATFTPPTAAFPNL